MTSSARHASSSTHRSGRRRGGMALMLVLFAIAIASVISLGVLSSFTPATVMATNVRHAAKAHALAESGIDAVAAYLAERSSDWHRDQGNKYEGVWFTDQALGGGSFSITAYRTDGDHTNNAEAFQNADRVTVTATAQVDGATAQVTRVLNEATSTSIRVALVAETNPVAGDDLVRQQLFESWGFSVITLDDNDAQSEFDDAADWADVFYVSENVLSTAIGTKVDNYTIGVVNEEAMLVDNIGASSSSTYVNNVTQINVVNNTHPITRDFSTGALTVSGSSVDVRYLTGTLAGGLRTLATRNGTSSPALAVLPRYAAAVSGTTPGRRVSMFFGDNSFLMAELNANGTQLIRNAIEWAAQQDSGLLSHWKLDETSGTTVFDSEGGFDGTRNNGVSIDVDGVDDRAFDFDGSNDHVVIEHDNAMLIDQGTVAFWFNSDDLSGQRGLFSKDATNFATGGHLLVRLDNGNFFVRIQNTTTSYEMTAATGLVSANTWHHFAFTFGPAGSRVYLDGTQVDSNAYTGGWGTSSGGIGNHEKIVLGASNWQSTTLTTNNLKHYFNGTMDDVRIYRRQLSASEVSELSSMFTP